MVEVKICAVGSMPAPGRLCMYGIVGGKRCACPGSCEHQRQHPCGCRLGQCEHKAEGCPQAAQAQPSKAQP